MTGKLLQIEPEDREPVAMVLFEPLEDSDDMPTDVGPAREAWHVRALCSVGKTCGVAPSIIQAACELVLEATDETAAWDLMARFVIRFGYDVYDSDTRFEVYDHD
jgi:hypothetical protein